MRRVEKMNILEGEKEYAQPLFSIQEDPVQALRLSHSSIVATVQIFYPKISWQHIRVGGGVLTVSGRHFWTSWLPTPFREL